MCALIAFFNATAWSLITPPFQGRDEVDHFAYVQQIAQTGALPNPDAGGRIYPPEETLVLQGLHYWQVRFTPYEPAISSVAEQRRLSKDVGAGASREGNGGAGGVSSQPPLYYSLLTIPYFLGGGNMLTQLQLMRLAGALLAALTALLVYLFLCEALPGARWACVVGAVCVALQPQFASTSGSVNPDALLYPLSAGIFLCLARAYRRGLTKRLAAALGGLVAAGLLTYVSFIGLAAGALLGVVLLTGADIRSRGRSALSPLAIALGIGGAPAVIYWLRNVLSGHSAFGSVSAVGSNLGLYSLGNEISYVWQLFLPRLPAMTPYFEGISTWRDIWFDRSVGLYGWMDTMFPSWVENFALVAALATALLCLHALVERRRALRARLWELLSYAAIAIGVLVTIGLASFANDVVEHQAALGEPRYLLPLLPLLGAGLVLAVRGAGRRAMPLAGAALLMLFLAHDVFSQLQVLGRYYG